MRVQMEYGLPGACIRIQDGTIAGVTDSRRVRDLGGHEEDTTEDRAVAHVLQRLDVLAWNDENMKGRRRMQVAKGDAVFVFGDDRGGNLFVNDSAERTGR
jgi:hypothetical protein